MTLLLKNNKSLILNQLNRNVDSINIPRPAIWAFDEDMTYIIQVK